MTQSLHEAQQIIARLESRLATAKADALRELWEKWIVRDLTHNDFIRTPSNTPPDGYDQFWSALSPQETSLD